MGISYFFIEWRTYISIDETIRQNIKDAILTYSGSADIDINLRFLNQEWFDILDGKDSTYTNAKFTAYTMDQNVWKDYLDEQGKAKYVIASPSAELFHKSYSTYNNGSSKKYFYCDSIQGYKDRDWPSNVRQGFLTDSVRNGIYALVKDSEKIGIALSSPYIGSDKGDSILLCGTESTLRSTAINSSGFRGLRPVVLIPKSDFNYTITED